MIDKVGLLERTSKPYPNIAVGDLPKKPQTSYQLFSADLMKLTSLFPDLNGFKLLRQWFDNYVTIDLKLAYAKEAESKTM